LSADLVPKDRVNQPNAALFDIQTDQRQGVRDVLASEGLNIIQEVPIVTMRLASIKGVTAQRLMRDPRSDIPRWALRREYRSTYRDSLDSSESSIAGTWPPAEKHGEVTPVSIEEGIAKELNVGIGDEIVFDVQGILMTNQIAHVRKVDWKRVQPNFFMVFPSGMLEEAPSFHIFTARVPSREKSAAMQRAVVKAFPNVSIIDLALVLDTIDAILSKIGFVIRFMALFTVATGVIVLIASVLTGRFQRVQEGVLLRTLGASGKQVQRILYIEYLLLGLLAATTGALLAVGSAWALAEFVFKVNFRVGILPLLVAVGTVPLLTLATGTFTNRGVLRRPPLEVLRQNS
jgi:putative ABC transport system permease protein